jgi:hypothetical protein
LDSLHHYAGPSTKTCEAGVYDGGGAHDLPCARGPAFSALAEGYMVSFVAIYERGFGMPSHQFLRLLLCYYGLVLHHLTPSGVLHIASFMTLCKAYLGIDPEFDL